MQQQRAIGFDLRQQFIKSFLQSPVDRVLIRGGNPACERANGLRFDHIGCNGGVLGGRECGFQSQNVKVSVAGTHDKGRLQGQGHVGRPGPDTAEAAPLLDVRNHPLPEILPGPFQQSNPRHMVRAFQSESRDIDLHRERNRVARNGVRLRRHVDGMETAEEAEREPGEEEEENHAHRCVSRSDPSNLTRRSASWLFGRRVHDVQVEKCPGGPFSVRALA